MSKILSKEENEMFWRFQIDHTERNIEKIELKIDAYQKSIIMAKIQIKMYQKEIDNFEEPPSDSKEASEQK